MKLYTAAGRRDHSSKNGETPGGFINKPTPLKKATTLILAFALLFNPCLTYAQQDTPSEAVLFSAAQSDQRSLKWKESLAKFNQIIASFPNSPFAQKAHIEIGKFHKYHRNWQTALESYHKAIAISPLSREAQDAKTAEAAIYYFRQDFPQALALFQEVLSQTQDWDQIKYCSYWLKELKRKLSFKEEESFSCGPKALEIVLGRLGLKQEPKELAKLFKSKAKQVSLFELTQVARQKGLKPKVVNVQSADLENLNKPFIALIEPEHYVVVIETKQGQIKFIDPQSQKEAQTSTLQAFQKSFKGYALVFLEDIQLAKAKYPQPSQEELQKLKGGVCWCCPVSGLGGSNPNTEYDGNKPCSAGMPSWMVNTVNLNFIVQDIDFSYTAKGMPIELVRTYNADDPSESIFGRSWTFNYNLSLSENPDTSIDIKRGDGRIDHFIFNGTRYQGPQAVYDSLIKNPDASYTLKLKADKSSYNFNSQGRLINIKDRNNNTTSLSYNSQGRLTTLTDPNGKNVSFSYGANNKVSKVTLADGRFAEFFYDANNNLTQTKDMVGATASFTYDKASYIKEITTPHQGKTTLTYTTTTLEGYALESITDSLSNKRSYSTSFSHYSIRILDSKNNSTFYDSNFSGYTDTITTPSGNSISFGYDNFGNRNKIIDTDDNTTTLTYDTNGNIASIKDALNNQVSLQYDNDNLARFTDPKGNIYDFTYDQYSNLIQTKDPDNKVTSFNYNPSGQLTRITDAKAGVTDFTYDSLGNLIKQTNPLGKITNYGYDQLGRLTSLTDPKGQAFAYTYDGVNHLTKITYPDASNITYTYNCCNLTQIQDSKGTLKFTYDTLSRLKSFTNYDNKVISYDYDSEDNLTKLTYPDNKAVQYEYDKDNRLTKVTDWLNNITTYGYDLRGNLISAKSPGLLTVYKYDNLSRLSKLLNYNSTNYTITSGYEFTLNELSNRTKIKRFQPLNSPTFNLPNSTYSYNSDNQLTASTGKTFSYDNNGNLTTLTQSAGNLTLTYDPDNQLTQYSQGQTTLSFQYDALGNRIKKTSGSTSTKYIIDPNRGLPSVLCETDASNNITAYYVYGLGLISKIEGTNAYFYQYDGIGSTVALTDKNANLKNKYAYDDFGNLATNSSETIANPFRYVGKFGVQTDLPDLLYMRARYYVPSIGRFIQYDPIGGTNLYTYVENSPINCADPQGLAGGPHNPRVPVSCTNADSCSVLEGKMQLLSRTIKSHTGWDRHVPPPRGGGKHSQEIADFWRALGNCQEIYEKNCKNKKNNCAGKGIPIHPFIPGPTIPNPRFR